jgi:periplasmic copper chaperone A
MSHRFPCGFSFRALVFVALAIICVGSAAAQQVKIGDLVLDHAWSRATPGGAKVGGGYLIIENKGATADKLIGGSSPVAGKVEVHEMAMNNGVMTMRLLKDGLPIPAGQSVKLAPGGYHVMLMDLKAPLKKGDKIPVTLKFEKAGDVKVTLDVQDIGATSPAPGHMDHSMPSMQQPKMSPDHKM